MEIYIFFLIFWLPISYSLIYSFIWNLFYFLYSDYRFENLIKYIKWDRISAKFWDTSIYFKITSFVLLSSIFFIKQYIVFVILFVYVSYVFTYFKSLNFDYLRYYKIDVFKLSKILIPIVLFSIFLSLIISSSINFYIESSGYTLQTDNHNPVYIINDGTIVFYDIYLFLTIYLLLAIFLDILMPIITFIFIYISKKISNIIEFLFLLTISQKYIKKNLKKLNILIIGDVIENNYTYIQLNLLKDLFNKIKLTYKEYQIFENDLTENIYEAISNKSINEANIFLLNNLQNWDLQVFKYTFKFDIVILNNESEQIFNKVNISNINKILKKRHVILSDNIEIIQKLNNLKIKNIKYNTILISQYQGSENQLHKIQKTILYSLTDNKLNIRMQNLELKLELNKDIKHNNKLLNSISSIIGIIDFLFVDIKKLDTEEVFNKILENNYDEILLNQKWNVIFGNNDKAILESKITKISTKDILSCIEYIRKHLGKKKVVLLCVWTSEKVMNSFVNKLILSKVDIIITNKYELFLRLKKLNNKNKEVYYVSTLNEALLILRYINLSNTGIIMDKNINNKFIEQII